ncbi:MAG: heavy metal translocating P-type ATPase metal-binding domain-containing protein [Verrucomicrobiales bacterium]|nr:heavy metal translocating P-type ATPase metal-binding domain-containing protein [Verrucomicrobiales bacterium]
MSETLTADPPRIAETDEIRKCIHCGNSFQPRFEKETFCCSGCRVVYELIQSGGFGSFYELLGRKVLQPAENADPAADQIAELEEAIMEAENSRTDQSAPAKLKLRIGNLSCTACVWLIDHLFRQHRGALKNSADTARSTLTLWWNPGEFDAIAFVKDLHQYGYPASIASDLDDDAPQESRALLTRLGVTAGLAMNTMVFTLPSYLGMETTDDLARLFSMVAFASATIALAVGGSYFFQRAVSALKMRSLHMDVPISLGLIAAYIGSLGGLAFGIEKMLYFDFVAMFAFLMLGGRWLHLRLLERNRRQLWARERDLSATFRLDAEGKRERIPLKKIEVGDRLEIAPGAMIPVNAELQDVSARFHLDWINGEPEPVPYRAGQTIPAGAKNGSIGRVEAISQSAFTGSFLEQLLGSGSADISGDEAKAHPILKYYLSTVILVAIAGATGWMVRGNGIADSLQVFISILVVSCPCALGLALPLLNEMLLSKLKHEGIFIRKNSIWKRLKLIRILAFDKTGTLTEPVKRLSDPEALESLDESALSALRHLTATNHHPAAKALHEEIISRFGLPLEPLSAPIEEVPGNGVASTLEGVTWKLGRRDWACDNSNSKDNHCSLSRDGVAVASFPLTEAIRDGAAQQLRRLAAQGYRLMILSGDPDTARVQFTAKALGIAPERVFSNLSPEDKAEMIQSDAADSTLFVGDGGNDSLAFAAAAASGTPATGIRAIESQADFVFTGRGFHAISHLLDQTKRRNRFVAILFATALTYNICAIGLCLAGLMNPLLAAIIMPLSSIVTTAIAARI